MNKKFRLIKLTPQNVEFIKDKNICCYEYSCQYIKELAETFDCLRIHDVIDGNERNEGVHLIDEREIKVYNSNHLNEICMETSVFLVTSDYFKEACDSLCRLLENYDYKGDIYYFVNHENEIDLYYRDNYKDSPLMDIIIFRSGPHASSYVKGMDFADNARALFEYMLSVGLNKKYRLVWLVKNPMEFEAYKSYENVDFLSFDWSVSEIKEQRDAYYQVLCLAKYIFFTDAYGFARNSRKDQIRIQLWHGCGFKTRVNFVRCEKRYEYNLVISEVYSEIHQRIYGLRKDQVLITGHAKADWLFDSIENFNERFAIKKGRKYIFWLPTFRMAKSGLDNLNEYEFDNQTGLPIVDTYEKYRELNEILEEQDIVLVIKLHPFQDKDKIMKKTLSNIFFLDNEALTEQDVPINRVLGYADALISDYSSVAVDYMLLNRPIAFTLDDVEEYEESRGFVFDKIQEWLPGQEIYTFANLKQFVCEIAGNIDSTKQKREKLLDIMHKYHDNKSCSRIVEMLHI